MIFHIEIDKKKGKNDDATDEKDKSDKNDKIWKIMKNA